MAPPTQSANGVLPAPAAILKKKDGNAGSGTSRGPRKPPAEKLKGVIRRLPPGMTQFEFEAVLGDEWKVGAGRVNWVDYKPGKISTDFSKPSRPSRAYVNALEFAHLEALDKIVMSSNWVDAKNTFRDPCLIAPPRLETAPYARVPLGKRKTDARQGTIDQDPEFIDFLQSLTNPVTKPAALDSEPAPKKEEVKTTPLIEHLREKKAAKERAGKSGKAKQQDTKETKGEKANTKGVKGQAAKARNTVEAQEKPKKLSKAEKAAQEAVKVLNKEAAAVTEKSANAQPAAKEVPERKPERAARPISVAARIQQDLGLSPAARRAKREPKAEATATTASTSSQDTSAAPSTPVAYSPKKSARGPRGQKSAEKNTTDTSAESSKPVPTGPAAQPTLLKKPAQPPKGPAAAQPAPPKGPKAQQTPSAASSSTCADSPSGPRQAFLKHANPSQGITEPLIEEALKPFGTVSKVEIDRKKGFAYCEFADYEGMKKAIAASPIKIAKGAIEVKERKERGQQQGGSGSSRGTPTAPMNMPRGGGGGSFRGSRRGGGGRGGVARDNSTGGSGSPAATNAAPAATAATAASSSTPAPPAS